MTNPIRTTDGWMVAGLEAKGFWASLCCGLIKPSAASVCGIGIVLAASLSICLIGITPRVLAKLNTRYLITLDPVDHYAEVSFLAMRLHEESDPPFAIMLTGDSAMRAAVTDVELLEPAAAEAIGEPAAGHNLTAMGMKLVEMAGVIDYAAANMDEGILLLQLGQFQLSTTPEQYRDLVVNPRLGVAGEAYDEELRFNAGAIPRRTGIYFVDHYRFYSLRLNQGLTRKLLCGPREQFARHTGTGEPLADWQWRSRTEKLREHLAHYHDRRDANMAIVRRMIDRLRKGGRFEIVLLEPPINPRFEHIQDADVVTDHQRYMREQAAALGVRYWNLTREAALREEDFQDFSHLADNAAQGRYTAVLADRVAQLAAEMKQTGGRP